MFYQHYHLNNYIYPKIIYNIKIFIYYNILLFRKEKMKRKF